MSITENGNRNLAKTPADIGIEILCRYTVGDLCVTAFCLNLFLTVDFLSNYLVLQHVCAIV